MCVLPATLRGRALGKAMKVLLIDDDEDIRHIMGLSLKNVGKMDVIGVPTSEEGIRVAEQESPDVILLDVMMPGTDGPTTLERLRANPATANIPVIFLTAKAMRPEIQRLRDLGATGVLTKPFDPMLLPDQIRSALGDR